MKCQTPGRGSSLVGASDPDALGGGSSDLAITHVRLARSDIRFAGASAKRIAITLAKFDHAIRTGPRLLDQCNVFFVPGRRCLFDARGEVISESKGTYCDADLPPRPGQDVKSATHEARKGMAAPIEPPANAARVSDPVLYLGEFHRHYGHFLTDGMARWWALDRVDPEARLLFQFKPDESLAEPHVRLVADRLGVERSRILFADGPMVLDRVLLPVAAMQQGRRIYAEFDGPHRRVGDALLALAPARRRPPVYLSRRGLGPHFRSLLGEAELELRLAREGYAIVQPERLSLPEQAALFAGDEPIIGAIGSALHTALFRTSPGLRVAVLTAGDVSGRFLLIDMLKNARPTYLECITDLTPEPLRASTPVAARTWSIDVPRAMALLDGAGFLA